MSQVNPYPLRVDPALMERFKRLAAENGRSVNKEIEHLMKEALREFELSNSESSQMQPSEKE